MLEILLFHHALGRTPGVLAFADKLRRSGDVVHVPDLYQGKIFSDLSEAVAHAQNIGFEVLLERAKAIAEELSPSLLYVGISLGVLPAQMLAQTRPGAAGALLLEACVPLSNFGHSWPEGVPVEIHGMKQDPWFAGEGDIDAARALVMAVPGATLFLYSGNQHLFTDNSLTSYRAQAADSVAERSLRFLDKVRKLLHQNTSRI